MAERAEQGTTNCNLGVHYGLGDFKTSTEYHERALKIAIEVGDRAGEGSAYGNLGIAHYGLGEFKEALNYYERALKIAKEVGDRAGEERSYSYLGIAYYGLGDFKKAIDYHERALKIAKQIENRTGEGGAYANLGNAHEGLGNFKTAIDYHGRHLKIVREVGDRVGEGMAYGNLGNAHRSLGDFKKAIDYHERSLKIFKEVGDRAKQGRAFGNLGYAYHCLRDFKKALDYHECCLSIAKEVGDRVEEGRAYANLGIVHDGVGDFKKAIECHERDLNIAKEVEDRESEGGAYGNLGNVHGSLGNLKKAIYYNERNLIIAKEVGNRAGEGVAHSNLGNAYDSLGDFEKAINYHERGLEISKDVGDRAAEGVAYCNLADTYCTLGDFEKVIDYHERCQKIAKEVGDDVALATSLFGLGHAFDCLGSVQEAIDSYQRGLTTINDIRDRLQFKDEWKISLRNMYKSAYASLWRLLLKQGKVVEALISAEQGRAQALKDLMELKYGLPTTNAESGTVKVTTGGIFSCLATNTVFIAIEEEEIVFWLCEKGKDVKLRRQQISHNNSGDDVATFLQSLMKTACQEIGVRAGVKCEDRSLDIQSKDEKMAEDRSIVSRSHSSLPETNALRTLYDVILDPVADLLHGSEVIFFPEGPLCLAPFAAFMNMKSKYLCESFRIRVIPSLTSLKLIADCAPDYHSKTGALLVGDPWVQDVVVNQGAKLQQLPCAREEVEMIGRIICTAPLTGKQATKDEVLKRLSSVTLVHIAAHGNMKTGEIALAPNPTQPSRFPIEKDFLLTMKDVLNVQMRARLVVLSCCHSARGEIKAEGVVGIARAFLGAGARSVLVSLWAIDDEATLEFMKHFYHSLVKGRSASEALNQAMKCMRETEKFSAIKYWAPFVLIGDDVTLEFGGIK